MNSGDVDVEFIATTPGSNAFVDITSIFINPTNNKFMLIGPHPVYETPSIALKSFVEVSNDNGMLCVDISLLSEKSINSLRKNIVLFGELVGAKYYFDEKVKISQEEYDQLLEEDVNLFELDVINTTFSFKTQTMIDMLLNKNVSVSTSDIADNLLSELFGPSVKIKDDSTEEVEEVLNALDESNDTIKYDSSPKIYDELDSENINLFESLLKSAEMEIAISGQEPEIITQEDLSKIPGDLSKILDNNIIAKQIETLYKSLYIVSAKESIEYEETLDVALTFLSKASAESYPADCIDFMAKFTNDFLDNESLNSLLCEFNFMLMVDKNDLVSLLESDTNYLDRLYNGDIREEIKVKEFLIKQFGKFLEQYTRMQKQYTLDGQLTKEKVIYIFCILFQMFHYVNKNRIKFTNEFDSKTSFLEDIKLKHAQAVSDGLDIPSELLLNNYNTQTLEGEKEIIEISNKLISEVKDLFNHNIR